MKTLEEKRIKFALSIMQGFAGGMLGGFAYFVISFSQTGGKNFNYAISFLPVFLVTFALLGCIKATIMWSFYRAIGRTLPALARISTSTFLSPLVLAFIALYFGFEENQIADFLVPILSLVIPVALIVGSSVKPWALFTFGSIVVGEVDHRSGSRSIFGTLGSLPLRFLGIGTTAYILLRIIDELQPVSTILQAQGAVILLAFLGAYPAFSAYITFRSPRKVSLCAIGVVLNAPVALIGVFSYRIYISSYWLHDTPPITAIFCGSFVFAWLIFLIARLNAKINSEPPLGFVGEETARSI